MAEDVQPLVSVIMPVYNAQATLPLALQSLMDQTYRPLEVVIVDDGSTDDSPQIIKQFLKESTSHDITARAIFRSSNSGSGASRRDAIQRTLGKYVAALDADDRFAPTAIADMVEAIRGYDIVAAEYFEERIGHRPRYIRFDADESADLNRIKMDTLRFSLWSKLIRADLYKKHLTFEKGIDCWEDLEQVTMLYAHQPKVTFLRKPIYYYTVNPKSLSHSDSEVILRQHLAVADRITRRLQEEQLDKEYFPFITYLHFIAKVKYLRNRRLMWHPLQRLRQWRDTYPAVNSHIATLTHVSRLHKCVFSIAYKLSKLI